MWDLCSTAPSRFPQGLANTQQTRLPQGRCLASRPSRKMSRVYYDSPSSRSSRDVRRFHGAPRLPAKCVVSLAHSLATMRCAGSTTAAKIGEDSIPILDSTTARGLGLLTTPTACTPPRSTTKCNRGSSIRFPPVSTTIRCGREAGSQRVTFLHRGPLRLANLAPLLERLGLSHQLPSILKVAGVALGGRFELPERSVLLGIQETSEGPELKLEILLNMLPDLPPNFLDLLALGLSERPHKLHALGHWLRAFTPPSLEWPGDFSVMSMRVTPRTSARVSLYLRPTDLEVRRKLSDFQSLNSSAAVA